MGASHAFWWKSERLLLWTGIFLFIFILTGGMEGRTGRLVLFLILFRIFIHISIAVELFCISNNSVQGSDILINNSCLLLLFLITLVLSQGLPWRLCSKNLPVMQEQQEMLVQFLGGENPLEGEMATHSSIVAWRKPWANSLVGYSS